MIKRTHLNLGGIPAILWGEPSNKVYFYVHGQDGRKEEAELLGEIVIPQGWQVLSVDLPGHGERKEETDAFDPWHIVPELTRVANDLKTHWGQIALCANSIGAWFSLLSMNEVRPERCLFISPILDMNRLIGNMMKWAHVTETQLQREGLIPTDFGQTLSWEYYVYARQRPIVTCEAPTHILYGDADHLSERSVVDQFVERFDCSLTVVEKGEHWFHTPWQLEILSRWLTEKTSV